MRLNLPQIRSDYLQHFFWGQLCCLGVFYALSFLQFVATHAVHRLTWAVAFGIAALVAVLVEVVQAQVNRRHAAAGEPITHDVDPRDAAWSIFGAAVFVLTQAVHIPGT